MKPGEPCGKEMYATIKSMFDGINDGNRDRMAACKNGRARDNPLLAIQCLAQMGAGDGDGDWSYSTTRFEKVACSPAQGQPDFVCDYNIGFNSAF